MNFNTNFASDLKIWDFHNRHNFIMKLWRCRHPTPTLYRAGCDAKPTHTFWPKKLLRKHDMVMKIQVLIPGTQEKGNPGRVRADLGQIPVRPRSDLGQTPVSPRSDPGQTQVRPRAVSGQT